MADLANSDLRRTLDKSSGQRRARIPASAEQGTILTSGEQRPVPSDRRVSTLAAASALPRRCPCMFTRVCTRGPRVCVCVCKVYVSTCIDLVYLPPFLYVCVSVYVRVCITHALHSNCTDQTEDAEKRRLCVLSPPFPATGCAEGKASRLTETPRWPRLGTQFSPGKQQGGRGEGAMGGE